MTQPHASHCFTMNQKNKQKFVDMECAQNNQDFMSFEKYHGMVLACDILRI
jgi:hypothetical protein